MSGDTSAKKDSSSESKSGLPEQVQKAFTGGTEARSGVNSWAAHASTIAITIVIAILVFGSIFFIIPGLMQDNETPVASASATGASSDNPVAGIGLVNSKVQSVDGTWREVIVIPDENTWSEPTRVGSGRCFYAMVDKYGRPPHKTQVSTYEEPDVWIDLEGAAEIPIGWVRHGSQGPGGTEVTQEIRRDGNC